MGEDYLPAALTISSGKQHCGSMFFCIIVPVPWMMKSNVAAAVVTSGFGFLISGSQVEGYVLGLSISSDSLITSS